MSVSEHYLSESSRALARGLPLKDVPEGAQQATILRKVGTSQQKGKPTLFETIDFLTGDFAEAIAGCGFDPQDLPGSFQRSSMDGYVVPAP